MSTLFVRTFNFLFYFGYEYGQAFFVFRVAHLVELDVYNS